MCVTDLLKKKLNNFFQDNSSWKNFEFCVFNALKSSMDDGDYAYWERSEFLGQSRIFFIIFCHFLTIKNVTMLANLKKKIDETN